MKKRGPWSAIRPSATAQIRSALVRSDVLPPDACEHVSHHLALEVIKLDRQGRIVRCASGPATHSYFGFRVSRNEATLWLEAYHDGGTTYDGPLKSSGAAHGISKAIAVARTKAPHGERFELRVVDSLNRIKRDGDIEELDCSVATWREGVWAGAGNLGDTAWVVSHIVAGMFAE